MLKIILSVFLFSVTILVNAQYERRSPYRTKYHRLGINMMNTNLDHSLTPKENILKSNFGAGQGYALENGRIFYFMPTHKKSVINVGLDWTTFSFTYNPLSAWSSYKKANGYTDEEIKMNFIASAAMKLGPVLSVNPVGDLVIDARAQLAACVYFIGPVYKDVDTEDAFFTYQEGSEETKLKMALQYVSTNGFKPNLGTTIRWKGIGAALDYSPGKINMKYTVVNNGVETKQQTKQPVNNYQVKLSITL